MPGTPTFLGYDEAIAAAKREPGLRFIGLQFEAPYSYLGCWILERSPELDVGTDVDVTFCGGGVFDVDSEEAFFDEQDAPDDAKRVFYASEVDLGMPAVEGMLGSHILHELLPGLPNPRGVKDKEGFHKRAGEVFRDFWRQA